MVGREVLLDVDRPPAETGDVVASVSELTVDDDRGVRAVDDVSFEVHGGEILGIAGVDGNGQSELIEALTGLRAPEAGTVRFLDEDVTDDSRRRRIEAGMAYVPEDRQERGVVMDFDLVENALLGSQHSPELGPRGRIDWPKTREHAETIIDEYDVRTPSAETSAKSLSGGNQQKFIVGREFERDPELVVASHPTRGVDVGSIEFIHERLLELREAGVAVLLISSKLEEVQGLSDRLAVMYEGEFVDVVDPRTTTESELGLLMAGQEPEAADEGDAEQATEADDEPPVDADAATGGERA
jgi:simple sugar transport system ATP-binding protein